MKAWSGLNRSVVSVRLSFTHNSSEGCCQTFTAVFTGLCQASGFKPCDYWNILGFFTLSILGINRS